MSGPGPHDPLVKWKRGISQTILNIELLLLCTALMYMVRCIHATSFDTFREKCMNVLQVKRGTNSKYIEVRVMVLVHCTPPNVVLNIQMKLYVSSF